MLAHTVLAFIAILCAGAGSQLSLMHMPCWFSPKGEEEMCVYPVMPGTLVLPWCSMGLSAVTATKLLLCLHDSADGLHMTQGGWSHFHPFLV